MTLRERLRKQIDKLNELLVDHQFKRQFRPNKKQMKKEYKCQYCGKHIPRGLKGAGFDVDMNGDISNVTCLECEKLFTKIREDRKKRICTIEKPSIAYCFNYCEKRNQCFASITNQEIHNFLERGNQ